MLHAAHLLALTGVMCSVERIATYSEIPELEAPARVPSRQLPAAWPSCGEIAFQDLAVRYQPHLPEVLRGISLVIPGQHKVSRKGFIASDHLKIVAFLGAACETDMQVCSLGGLRP